MSGGINPPVTPTSASIAAAAAAAAAAASPTISPTGTKPLMPASPAPTTAPLEAATDTSPADAASKRSIQSSEKKQQPQSPGDNGTTGIAGADDAGPKKAIKPIKAPKRRAPRACVSCRARKVRCDVIEGAPCGNCRWDKVECIVQENRRRRKKIDEPHVAGLGLLAEAPQTRRPEPPLPVTLAIAKRRRSGSGTGPSFDNDIDIDIDIDNDDDEEHDGGHQDDHDLDHDHRHDIAPENLLNNKRRKRNLSSCGRSSEGSSSNSSGKHIKEKKNENSKGGPRGVDARRTTSRQGPPSLYQNHPFGLQSAPAEAPPRYTTGSPAHRFFPPSSIHDCASSPTLAPLAPLAPLPPFIRPLPGKIPPEDVSFLYAKGALSVPGPSLQSALLRAYIEFVHPFMPLLDLHPFLNVINCEHGFEGQVSLFLYHAVMFAATAFVDARHLLEAGYPSRKAARRALFHRTRLLYDFDYEPDRLVLIQGLLLMTYWYETPDDQKDTWHWMGVAVSLAHTIGLHRDMEATALAPATRRLWKRIWWSCFMRDRLVALGMRRPTRIRDEDFDVPMLAEADFEIEALAGHVTVVGPECALAHDVEMQRELATLCVQKAKLCVCISDMLRTQYSVLIRDNIEPENTANSTMMLFPNNNNNNNNNKSTADGVDGVDRIDASLERWLRGLPASCRYRALQPRDVRDGRATLAVHRTLLHLAYHTTVSALHRPQFLPSSPAQAPTLSREAQDVSRQRVKEAAARITKLASELYRHRLEGYLPTTGVTFILPAMIIHLLEMKSPSMDARARATRGFRQCMRVMGRLREIYASADYATGFLDAALRKAAIDINANIEPSTLAMMKEVPQGFSAHTPPPENSMNMNVNVNMNMDMTRNMNMNINMDMLPCMDMNNMTTAHPHGPAAPHASDTPLDEGGTMYGPDSMAKLRTAYHHPSPGAGRQNAPAPMTINTSVFDFDRSRASARARSMADSPPHTDDLGGAGTASASAGLTPQTANDSEGHPLEMDVVDMEFSQAPDDVFDWNVVSGTDLDINQWLQFPAEGLNGEESL